MFPSPSVLVRGAEGGVVAEEDGFTPPFPPWGGELLATTVHEALIEKQTVSCILGFHQIPAFNLSNPRLSAPQISCILSLAGSWDSFKTLHLKGPGKVRPIPLP